MEGVRQQHDQSGDEATGSTLAYKHPGHPQGRGVVEHLHETLGDHLRLQSFCALCGRIYADGSTVRPMTQTMRLGWDDRLSPNNDNTDQQD